MPIDWDHTSDRIEIKKSNVGYHLQVHVQVLWPRVQDLWASYYNLGENTFTLDARFLMSHASKLPKSVPTVKDIKRLIENGLAMRRNSLLTISSNERQLEDDNIFAECCKLDNKNVKLYFADTNRFMDVHVDAPLPIEKTLRFKVPKSACVGDLKALIQRKEHIPIDQQVLVKKKRCCAQTDLKNEQELIKKRSRAQIELKDAEKLERHSKLVLFIDPTK